MLEKYFTYFLDWLNIPGNNSFKIMFPNDQRIFCASIFAFCTPLAGSFFAQGVWLEQSL